MTQKLLAQRRMGRMLLHLAAYRYHKNIGFALYGILRELTTK